jgi:hypothetical protein
MNQQHLDRNKTPGKNLKRILGRISKAIHPIPNAASETYKTPKM